MQALAVVLFPVMLMLFALAMERVETRLKRVAVREHDVEEFLDQATSSDVAALAVDGFPSALARFNNRRGRRLSENSEPSEVLLDGSNRRAS